MARPRKTEGEAQGAGTSTPKGKPAFRVTKDSEKDLLLDLVRKGKETVLSELSGQPMASKILNTTIGELEERLEKSMEEPAETVEQPAE